MCRMVGIVSLIPLKALECLAKSECSLLAQAERGKQSDGWGIGYYDASGNLRVFKSPNSVYSEKDLFIRVSSSIVSKIIIAHIRKASNPMNLPREKLIGLENTQPFTYKNLIFAHNGSIKALEARKKLGEYDSLIKGVNDSEVYFALLIKHWYELKGLDPKERFLESIERTERDLWSSSKERRKPYSSLSMLFSDGKQLYAFNKYIEGEDYKSICYEDSAYFQMVFRHEKSKLIIASEKMDRGEWKQLSNGEAIIARPHGKTIKYERVLAGGA